MIFSRERAVAGAGADETQASAPAPRLLLPFSGFKRIPNLEDRSVTESKSVSRGVLWLIVACAAAILMALAHLSATLINQRIDTLDRRGVQNQERIVALETKYSVIEVQLKQNSKDHEQIIDLLKEHMGRR